MSRSVVGLEQDADLVTGTRGTPRLLRWHARTYRVTDAPTPLEDALEDALTHPLPVRGWRFQGTCAHDGETLVFDVIAFDGGWHVLRTSA